MNNHKLIFIGLFVFVVASYILTQLTNDFEVFWAYGRLVNNSEVTGISALLDPWELKGALFKAYIALSYAITSMFSTDFGLMCQSLYKLFGVLIYLSLLGLSIYLMPDKYLQSLGGKKRIWMVLSILLLAVHFISHFQPEMWGVLILLLSFSLYMRDSCVSSIMAAVVFCMSFYLKSPLPLLGGTLFFGSLLIRDNKVVDELKKFLPFALTAIVFLPLSLLALWEFFPQELIDIWGASYYQHTLLHSGAIIIPIYRLIMGLVKATLYNPVVFVGILCSVHISISLLKDRRYLHFLYLILIWAFPLLYVLISNCFFMYHYYTLVLSAIFVILYYIRKGLAKNVRLMKVVSFATLGFYILFLSAVAPTNLYAKNKYSESWNKINKKGYKVGGKLGDDSILFLDDGRGAFLFSNKSYLRYFYPLPLQRINPDNPYTETTTYKEVKDKTLAYKGEYITLFKDWFYQGNNEDIRTKIESQYEQVDVIDIPDFSLDLFRFGIEEGPLIIYKRKRNL